MSEGTAGTVTLSIEAHDELRGKISTAYAEMADLRKQLAEAERSGDDERLEAVIEALEQAIPVIQFAVANLHPDTVKGWPHRELRAFANSLELLPGATPAHKELAQDLRVFAAGAESAEGHRQARGTDLRRLRDAYESLPENLSKTKAELIAEFDALPDNTRDLLAAEIEAENT